jgi:AraC-like DNA-binding protein
MISSSNASQVSVHRIGKAARDFLKAGSQGRILAVFSNAVYLNNSYDEISWLVTEKIPMHRRGIQIPGALPRVAVNSSFNVRGEHLLLGTDIDLDMSRATIWESPSPNLDKVLPFEELPGRWRDVSSLFDGYPSPKGFGLLLAEIMKLEPGSLMPAAILDYSPALKSARSALNEMLVASIAMDFPRILRISKDLIGLGEGLTPSGDDFIGGLLFSSFVLQEIYAQYQGFAPSEVELLVDHSRNQTNLISHSILKDLAAGCGFDTLHRFINAVLTDQDLESTYYLGLELIRIGHSTGWDSLTGVWTGMFLSICSRATSSRSMPAFTFCRY